MPELLKILIIDDNAVEAEILQELLLKEKMNCSFQLAMDKNEFIHALDSFQPDLILFDNALPKFYATEALSIIKERALLVPFILITGTVSEEFAATIIKLGADDYILKNRLTKLPAAIDAALIHKAAEKEKQRAYQKLKESEERYRLMVERVSDAFLSLNKDWCFTYANRKAEQILGKARGSLQGKNIWAEFPLEKDDTLQYACERAMNEQQYVYLEYYDDFSQKWLESHIYPSPDGISIYFHDVTEKKVSEKEFNKLANRNKVILDTMRNSFLLTDARLNIVDVNDSFCQMLGYTKEELLKMHVGDIDAKLSNDEIRLHLDKSRQGNTIQLETRNRRKDGSIIDVEVSLTKMEIEGQVYFASFGQDISKRKKAEEKLKESEKQLLSAAQIAKLAYWEYDVKKREFTFNDQFYFILKTTAENAGGYTMSAERYEELFIDPEDRGLVRSETIKAIKSNDPHYSHQFEYRIVYPNWDIGYMAVHYFADKDSEGETIKVFGTIQDITDRKAADERLRKSNERFEMVAMATNDVIWDWDLISGNMWWNKNFYSLFMLKKEEVKKDIHSWYDGVHPEDLERVKKSLLQTIDNKENYWSDEYRFLKSNGEIVEVLDRGYVLYNEEGKAYRMIGSMLDITERKKATQALLNLEKKIMDHKLQEQKKVMRAIINAQEKERNRIALELHDNVCQLLTSIKFYISKATTMDGNMKQFLEYPLELLVTSIDSLRTLSKENITPLKDFDLQDMVQSLVDYLQHASSAKAQLNYRIADFSIDEDLKLNIYRILQEQINNIVKHSSAQNVTIQFETKGDHIHIEVVDDGKGFDPRKKRKGIGLSNMVNRVESFNGHITLESVPGKGSKIEIDVPIKTSSV
jgi:PAS domain S-box-containing protein